MDLVTFATRVCKLLGVETMIGMLENPIYFQVDGLTLCSSYKCCWRFERELRRRGHRMLE